MNENQETVQVNDGTPRWLGVAIVALAVVSLIALGVGWNASNHVREAQQASANDNQALRQNLDVVGQRLSQAEAVNAQLQGNLSVVTDRLKAHPGRTGQGPPSIRKDQSGLYESAFCHGRFGEERREPVGHQGQRG